MDNIDRHAKKWTKRQLKLAKILINIDKANYSLPIEEMQQGV